MRDRAAYMREYRAKVRADHATYDAAKPIIGAIKTEAGQRIAELEAEVAHLKRELASRPTPPIDPAFAQYRPAPKPGKR